MSMKAELELKSALLSTGLVQPVESSAKGGHAEVLSKQVPGQEKPWMAVVVGMLKVATDERIGLHICKRFLLMEGQLVYGWHLSVTMKGAKVVESAVKSLIDQVLSKAKPSLSPVVEERQAPPRPAPSGGRRQAEPDPTPQSQEAGVAGISVVARGHDAKGKAWTVQEMPLPHVTRDMNVPTQKRKGARSILED